MQVIIMEKDKEIATSLKRVISLKFPCVIENGRDIKKIIQKYNRKENIFMISIGYNIKKEQVEKLNSFLHNKLKLELIILTSKLKDKKDHLHFLKIPFHIDELYKAVSEVITPKKKPQDLNRDLLLKKYEDFRSIIHHNYFQYIFRNWDFYKFLLLNFYDYVKLIFGINLEREKKIGKNDIKMILKKYEEEKEVSLLHDLMKNLKLNSFKEEDKFQKNSNLKRKFFKNLDILIEVLRGSKTIPLKMIEETVAENFLLSWYLWRELTFLEEYNDCFYDGFYKGCFRILLSYTSPYYEEVKNNALLTICKSLNIEEALNHIKLKVDEIKEALL